MGIYEIIAGAVLVVVCIVVVLLVLSQESKQSGMGAFSGASENYQSMQSRSVTAKAVVATKWAAGLLFAVIMIVNILGVIM